MFYEYNHFELAENFFISSGRNLTYPGHMHQSFEIMVVLSGTMEVTVDGRTYLLTAGEAAFIFPNQIHSMESQNCEQMVCIFSSELVKAFSAWTTGKIPLDNHFMPDKYLVDTLHQMTEQATLIEKKGVLYSLCAAFDKTAKYRERSGEESSLLYKIFLFVEENYNRDCSLNKLSRQTGYSYSYLSRYFKRIVNISYNDYVNQYRINHACYLLINTDSSVLQCALDSGYDSLRSFNRNFMTYMSVTPNVYRKSHQSPGFFSISQ